MRNKTAIGNPVAGVAEECKSAGREPEKACGSGVNVEEGNGQRRYLQPAEKTAEPAYSSACVATTSIAKHV